MDSERIPYGSRAENYRSMIQFLNALRDKAQLENVQPSDVNALSESFVKWATEQTDSYNSGEFWTSLVSDTRFHNFTQTEVVVRALHQTVYLLDENQRQRLQTALAELTDTLEVSGTLRNNTRSLSATYALKELVDNSI